jgi:dTDP-4-dehydrorhamnose 3,5-epimerase
MNFVSTPLTGSYEITLAPFEDNRGWFVRFFDKTSFAGIGHTADWVQMNHSYTKQKGSIRGMHFQRPPHAEIKVVRCIRGAVLDVIVDLRKGSPSFLKHHSCKLTATNNRMLYIPQGFAHGFQVLEDDSELLYLHSEYYSPSHESALRFNDPLLSIAWPLEVTEVSEKDKNHPLLNADFEGINI